jgi:hypothetical protein
MAVPFNPAARSVLVPVIVGGPRQAVAFRFAVDTGATQTTIRSELLRVLGYDLNRPVGRKRIRFAGGTATIPLFRVASLTSLGQSRTDFVAAAQDLPPTVEADGLLGLDFFRGLVLTLDFSRGLVSLPPSRLWWQFWR